MNFYIRSYGSYQGQGQGGHHGAPPPPQPPPPDDGGKKSPNSGKLVKKVAIEDGYYGGYGIDEASLLEGDDFELVGKCIFIYWGHIGVQWGSNGARWGSFGGMVYWKERNLSLSVSASKVISRIFGLNLCQIVPII